MLYVISDERYKALTADSAKLLEDVIYNEAYIRRSKQARSFGVVCSAVDVYITTLLAGIREQGVTRRVMMHMV